MNLCFFVFALTCLPYGHAEGFFSKFMNHEKSKSDNANDEDENVCESVRVMPRIAFAVVGGTPLKLENSAPYIAAIGERLSNGSVSWFCGGSLLSTFDILTAAHCLISRNVTTVRVGSFSTAKRSTENDYDVSETIIHPGYKITESYNDIAVIKVNNKIDFSKNIKPVCLPTNDNERYEKERAKVIGWGAEEFGGEGTQKLQKVEVEVFTNSNCEKAYSNSTIAPKSFPKGIKREQLCAGSPKGGKDACQGDSGGPLVLTDESGIVRQIGIVSTGAGCGFKMYPGVYTRVSSYADWIQKQINKAGYTRSSQNRGNTSKEQTSRLEVDENVQTSKHREPGNGRPLENLPQNGQSWQLGTNESTNARPVNRSNSSQNYSSHFRDKQNSEERPSQGHFHIGKPSKNTARQNNLEGEIPSNDHFSRSKGSTYLSKNVSEIPQNKPLDNNRFSEHRDQTQKQHHSLSDNFGNKSMHFQATTIRTTGSREKSQHERYIDEQELGGNQRSGQRLSSNEQFSERIPESKTFSLKREQLISLNNNSLDGTLPVKQPSQSQFYETSSRERVSTGIAEHGQMSSNQRSSLYQQSSHHNQP